MRSHGGYQSSLIFVVLLTLNLPNSRRVSFGSKNKLRWEIVPGKHPNKTEIIRNTLHRGIAMKSEQFLTKSCCVLTFC